MLWSAATGRVFMESQAGLANYCEIKLNLPWASPESPDQAREAAEYALWPDEIWSLYFMSDSLYQGRRFRTLNILHKGVRDRTD